MVNDAGSWRIDALAIVSLLVAVNLAVALVFDGWATAAAQLLAAAAAVGYARQRGYGWTQLGLAREDAPSGLLLGGLVAAAIAAVVALVAIVPATSGSFEDDRFLDLTTPEVIWEVGFRVPFVTALTEELLFRSVLLGVLLIGFAAWRAVLISSFLFGLWHVLTTLGDLDGNEVTDDFSRWEVVGGVLGVVAVTAAAGIGFAWLRLRSGSALAPWLAHTAINASTFLAGVILAP